MSAELPAKKSLTGEVLSPDQDAFVIHGYRDHAPYQMGARDLETAIAMSACAISDNIFYPEIVKNLSGETVLNRGELEKRMDDYNVKSMAAPKT